MQSIFFLYECNRSPIRQEIIALLRSKGGIANKYDENGDPICTPHVATISGGSEKVFVVNAAIARIGDAVDAGSLTSGSSKVFSG